MSYGSGPWVNAQLTDEFFAYVYSNGSSGLKEMPASLANSNIINMLFHIFFMIPQRCFM